MEIEDRRFPLLKLSPSRLEGLLNLAFPGTKLERQELIAAGGINTIYKLKCAERPGYLALRIYQRDSVACEREARLLARLARLVPVPEVIYAEFAAESLEHPFVITSWCPGVTLAHALAGGAGEQSKLGHSVGVALAAIGSMEFDAQEGRLNADLSVTPWSEVFGLESQPADPVDGTVLLLKTFLDRHAGRHLGKVDSDRVLKCVARWGGLLPKRAGRTRLVHGDFGPANIVVDVSSSVTGVIDWEWAHAGNPMFDLANLFRDRGLLTEGFAGAFERAFVDRGGRLHPRWRMQVLLVDLISLLEMIDVDGALGPNRLAALRNVRRSIEMLEAASP